MKIIKSFKYAIKGIIYAIKNERNMRIHTVASVCVFLFSLFFDLNSEKYILLLLTCSFVMVCELVNSAIENLIDICATDYNSKAKAAKDIAAGFVLLSACSAVVVGILIFKDIKGYINVWNFLCAFPWVLIPMSAFGVFLYFYIFMGPAEIKNITKSKIKHVKKRRKNGR
ncbi:MAG: diacylglycerol kinase family protein [Clostridia bacterium]|nr:diacylglycerol kinase family protein [Clostridia bacterium]